MARVDATAAKAAVALAAAQLTILLKDDTVDFFAIENRNPHSPIRIIQRLFDVDSEKAVVSSNDAYIDAAYAGKFPTLGNQFDKIGTTPPITVVSATLETAAPNDIVITFSVNVQGQSLTSIAGAAAAGKTITSITVYENVMTVTTDVAFIAADVVTVSSTIAGINLNALVLTDQAVTNNIV